jgi:hypothetical protein
MWPQLFPNRDATLAAPDEISVAPQQQKAEPVRETKPTDLASRSPWARMLRIQKEIQDGKQPNCVQLAAELEIYVRTLKRDIEFMARGCGRQLCTTHTPTGSSIPSLCKSLCR